MLENINFANIFKFIMVLIGSLLFIGVFITNAAPIEQPLEHTTSATTTTTTLGLPITAAPPLTLASLKSIASAAQTKKEDGTNPAQLKFPDDYNPNSCIDDPNDGGITYLNAHTYIPSSNSLGTTSGTLSASKACSWINCINHGANFVHPDCMKKSLPDTYNKQEICGKIRDVAFSECYASSIPKRVLPDIYCRAKAAKAYYSTYYDSGIHDDAIRLIIAKATYDGCSDADNLAPVE